MLSVLPLAHIYQIAYDLAVLASGGCIDYGSPYTLTESSPMVVDGEIGDLVASQPNILMIVPLMAMKMKASIESKVSNRGTVSKHQFN